MFKKLHKKFHTFFELLREGKFLDIFARIINTITFGAFNKWWRLHVYKRLENQYSPYVNAYVIHRGGGTELSKTGHDKIIWWLWLQGYENAPEICKACLKSWQKWYPDYKINILDEKNIFDYISLPDYITEKYHAKKMIPAHYADIIRTQLLYTHGGIWSDSTIYVSGRHSKFEKMLSEHLAFFEPHSYDIFVGATYFIVSDKNSPSMKLARDLQFDYWKNNNRAAHYFFIDMCLKMSKYKFPDEWQNMPLYPDQLVAELAKHMYEPYSPDLMKQFTDASDFHKLTYKLSQTPSPNSIYRYIVDNA